MHVIGIRSKTKLTEKVLKEAKNLLVIGCFCIGTNQVDLAYAAKHGIAVFNSPFANSRSVAELVIAEIITLARQLGDRSNEMHRGTWNKVSSKCWEIRGKTLGIVGYGHIGSQLSVLAEAMGMSVIYYDVLTLMAIGTSRQVPTLEALLEEADFVTLHVPETPETKNMISNQAVREDEDRVLSDQCQPRHCRRHPSSDQRDACRQGCRRGLGCLSQRAGCERRLLQQQSQPMGARSSVA